MNIFEPIEEKLGAFVIATVAALFAAPAAWLLTTLIGARFFRGEWPHGTSLPFTIPAAIVVAVVVFIVVFRKFR